MSGFLVITTIVGNAMGWVYQILVGRALGVELFGLFSGLLGIFYVATLGGGAFRIQVAAITARIAARMGEDEAARTFLSLWKRFILIFLPVLLFFIIASRQIASFFHTESTGAILILGFAIFGTSLFMIVLGFLQGLQRFKHLAYIGYILPPALKLLASLGFIALGWKLLGAMAAVLVAEFSGLLAALLSWRSSLARAAGHKPANDASVLKIVLTGSVFAFFIAAPTNLDVPLVVHFFSASESGIFACVATFGRVITFLPMGVSLVMLPIVAERHALNKPTASLAWQSLLLTLILSGVATLCYWLFPDFFIRLFLGESYLGAAVLLGWYGTAMVLFSLNLVLVQYAVAVGRQYSTIIAGSATLGIILTIALWHTSLEQVIAVMLVGNLLLLLLCCPLLLRGDAVAMKD